MNVFDFIDMGLISLSTYSEAISCWVVLRAEETSTYWLVEILHCKLLDMGK